VGNPSGAAKLTFLRRKEMKGPSGKIYCDVIGCGEEATHLDRPNPFEPSEICDFCERCLAAGMESVEKGHPEEMPKDIYYHYYGRNWVGPSGYQVHRKRP